MTAYFAASPPTTSATLADGSGIAAGTIMLTQTGARTVESLSVGDKIITRDHGLQPLRRITASVCKTTPIHFAAGALGNHDAITLAAGTRVLIRTPLVKRLFGESEVFALARDLVNGTSIRALTTAAPLQMLHLMLEHAEILRAAELEVESLPSDTSLMQQLDSQTRAAILRLLPTAGDIATPVGRSCLLAAEARMLGRHLLRA